MRFPTVLRDLGTQSESEVEGVVLHDLGHRRRDRLVDLVVGLAPQGLFAHLVAPVQFPPVRSPCMAASACGVIWLTSQYYHRRRARTRREGTGPLKQPSRDIRLDVAARRYVARGLEPHVPKDTGT